MKRTTTRRAAAPQPAVAEQQPLQSPTEVLPAQQPAEAPGQLQPIESPAPGQSVVDPTQAMIALVQRLATDPSVDVGKLEKLMDLQERVIGKQQEQAFIVSMQRAQERMRVIGKDMENSQTRSRYASYDKLDRALRPIYTSEGFSLSFDTKTSSQGPDFMTVLCYVSHIAGHTRMYSMDIPTDGKGAKGNDVMTKTHATGAGASYASRYLLKMIWNVAVGEEDQDGNDPSGVRVDEWIQQVDKSETLDALADVKDRGFAVIEEKGTAADYKSFHAAVLSKRRALDKAGAPA